MSNLATSKSAVPQSMQALMRQMARPWGLDTALVDSMLKPGFAFMDPAFNQPFDALVRNFSDSLRLRDGLLGNMDVQVDVVEKNGAYKVHADLPGVKKEDINVSVDGNVVNIEARTQSATDSKGGKVVMSERRYGAVSRSFTLDQDVDESKATAKYADGVLTLELPKKASAPKAEAKQITVQ